MAFSDELFLDDARGNHEAMRRYMMALVEEPLWSPGDSDGRRIRFNDAQESKVPFADQFGRPGCYLQGINDRVLYVGCTMKQTLWRRLRGRYFIGAKTQHGWAKEYEEELINQGIDGFPPDVIATYKKQYGGGTYRLDGAVMFARCGVNDVWFHLLPTSDGDFSQDVEQALMSFCKTWNEEHGYPPMLNLRFGGG